MAAFILIILLQGWGSGIGSTGNVVAMQEFSSRQTCQAAADEIRKMTVNRNDYPRPICLPK